MDDDRGTFDEARQRPGIGEIAWNDVGSGVGADRESGRVAGEHAKAEPRPAKRREQMSAEEARDTGEDGERRGLAPAAGSRLQRQATEDTTGGTENAPDSSI